MSGSRTASPLKSDDQIAALPGLGQRSQEMLAAAGINTLEQLRALGSAAAWVKAKRAHPDVSLNLLWGLEAALTGLPWQEVAREHRTSLLLAVDACEKNS